MKSLDDKWLRRIAIPILALGANFAYLEVYTPHYTAGQYAVWLFFCLAYVALLWEIIVRWLLYVRSRYAHIRQTQHRVAITVVGHIVLTMVMQVLFVGFIDAVDMHVVPITLHSYIMNVVIGLACTLLVGTTYEAIYYLSKYGEAVQESEALKKEGLQSQYESLKNQVNPHFLFNSLNCLSALISEDKKRAGLFLDELASVYRYLLQAGQKPLTTLAEEMTFLESYRYLLTTRFGLVLRWEISVNENYSDCLLPSLTLQILIENALRHNQLQAELPLILSIYTTSTGELIVRNSILRRRTPVAPPLGKLVKLATNFEMAGLPSPVIEDDGRHFTVRIALLNREEMQSPTPKPSYV